MATSKSANTYNRQNWEDAEFPILCQTCLGDNPYVRMTKERYGKECKICSRPFTVFRWCPGARMRFKKTEICQTCCKLKNVCQTCLLDLEFGLPIQVRDVALTFKEEMPKSEVNKEFYTQNMERELANNDPTAVALIGKAPSSSDLLLKLARTTPYYKRNRPHICSFWVKGECKRGEECPYRHEKPTDPDDPLADQNIKDRYYGINDPVADKLLRRAAAMPHLEPPDDQSITTLYVGNLGDKIIEKDLRDYFYQFGEIRSITVVSRQQCAFIQFTSRTSAEAAAEGAFNKLIINGRRLNIKWGRSQAKIGSPSASGKEGDCGKKLEPVPGLPALPPPPEELTNNYFNLNQPTPLIHTNSLGIPIPAPQSQQQSGGHPPNLPTFMGPPGVLPPGPPPLHPPVGVRPPGMINQSPASLPGLLGQQPPPVILQSVVPQLSNKPTIHYPSQDPQRMGSTAPGSM